MDGNYGEKRNFDGNQFENEIIDRGQAERGKEKQQHSDISCCADWLCFLVVLISSKYSSLKNFHSIYFFPF